MAAARALVMAAVAMVLTSGATAWAGAPTEQLRGRIDRVLQVLEDPQLKPDRKSTRLNSSHQR